MASTIKVKRSAVPGNAPNTSNIDTGELALNTADRILYSTDGSAVFEIGANLTSLSVSSSINVSNATSLSIDGSAGTDGQILAANITGGIEWRDDVEVYNHTWAVAGTITAATLPCMFVLTGNTAGYNEVVEFSRYRAKIGSGSGSVDVKFQKNGVDITNTSQTINTSKQTVTFTAETLVNEDELTVVTSSPTNSPVDLSVTAFFTRKRYIS